MTEINSNLNLDWKNLGFQYRPTKGFVIADYKKGEWGACEERTDPYFKMHMAANVLHYGQACFEGLKAFRTKDNRIVIFRPDKNARRLQESAQRICMPFPTEDVFIKACIDTVRLNAEFVPPYGTGASLYLRPTLIGTQPVVGLSPSEEYSFYVFSTPVGPYYPNGFSPVDAVVIDEFDRAANRGTGQAKVAGNYAAGMKPTLKAKEMGYPIALFLDSVEHKYIDEFGTSNFIGITETEYKTPSSPSILKSITNDSLQVLAKEFGLKVVKEMLDIDSLNQFKEVGACGTAAVVTPISSITYGEKKWQFGKEVGPYLNRFYQELQGIQYGDREDKYGWLVEVS